jgi:hypothetical protein
MPRKNARPAAKKRKAKLAALMAMPKHKRPRRADRQRSAMPSPKFIMAEMAAASALLSGLLRKSDAEATRP